MKQFIAAITFILFSAGHSYTQFSIFDSKDFSKEIKNPQTLETVKDVFQGVWLVDLYSPEGEVVDTTLVKLVNYSTKNPDLIFFSSFQSESYSEKLKSDKIIFFQSETKSTIRFSVGNDHAVDFDGFLNQDLSIHANVIGTSGSSVGNFAGFKLKATKISDDLGSMWICGNDDGKREDGPKHGRHSTRKSQEVKEFETTYGCTKWKRLL